MKIIELPARKRLRRLSEALKLAASKGTADVKFALRAQITKTEAALQRKRRVA